MIPGVTVKRELDESLGPHRDRRHRAQGGPATRRSRSATPRTSPRLVLDPGRRADRGQRGRHDRPRRPPRQDPPPGVQDQGHHRRSARASPSSSRPAARRTPPRWPGSTASSPSRARSAASASSSSRTTRPPQEEEHLIAAGKHIIVQPGDVVHKGQHLTEGAADPARDPRDPRAGGPLRVPDRPGPGGLPPPGRDDQRQAHRDHHPPDAAQGPDHRPGRQRVLLGRAGRPRGVPLGQPSDRGGGRQARRGRADPPRHHQGLARDGELHLGRLLPGDDARPHRRLDARQGRPAQGLQGERDHGPPDTGGHGPAPVQAPQDQPSLRHRARSTRTSPWRPARADPTGPRANCACKRVRGWHLRLPSRQNRMSSLAPCGFTPGPQGRAFFLVFAGRKRDFDTPFRQYIRAAGSHRHAPLLASRAQNADFATTDSFSPKSSCRHFGAE